MKIHTILHAPHEDIGNIYNWAVEKKYNITSTHLYKGDFLPDDTSDIDFLIIMGGPMGVYDESEFLWLVNEKKFIEKAINSPIKKILGICLGAQLLANVLGAEVRKNRVREIGWFPVNLTMDGKEHPAFKDVPGAFDALHWHGDTFDIPSGAKHIAFSAFCENQAFSYRNIIGLQFHPEVNRDLLAGFLNDPGMELIPSPSVNNPESMMKNPLNFLNIEKILYEFIDNFIEKC